MLLRARASGPVQLEAFSAAVTSKFARTSANKTVPNLDTLSRAKDTPIQPHTLKGGAVLKYAESGIDIKEPLQAAECSGNDVPENATSRKTETTLSCDVLRAIGNKFICAQSGMAGEALAQVHLKISKLEPIQPDARAIEVKPAWIKS